MTFDATIRVYDHHREPLPDATVELTEPERRRLDYDRSRRAFRATNLPAGDHSIRVSAEGLLTETRRVTIDRDVELTFILGRRGMPFYQRGSMRVPFQARRDLVAIVTRTDLDDTGERRFERATRQLGLEPVALDLASVPSGFHVRRLPDGDDRTRGDLVRRLRRRGDVLHAGALIEMSDSGGTFLSRDLIVKVRPDTPRAEVERLADEHGLEILRSLPYSADAHHLRASDDSVGYELLDVCDALMESPLVVYAEPDLVVATVDDQIVPADFLYASQWHLPLSGLEAAWQVLRDRNAPFTDPGDAGDVTFGSHEVIVGVMDRGIESQTVAGAVTARHPDFSGTVTNGATKVYRFFDFATMVANNDAPPNNHGMGVVGVVAAVSGNASPNPGEIEGVVGPAANCRVMGLIRPAAGTETQYADAYYWAAGFDPNSAQAGFPNQINPGADIITNRFGAFSGSAISGTMSDCFDDLTDNGRGGRGVVLFFSAGNGDTTLTLQRPWAAYERTIAVAASTEDEVRAPYSNFGPEIDICAPSSNGSGIVTSDFVGGGNLAGNTGGPLDYRDSFGGTSSATPLAAGVAALMLSVNPFLAWSDVRDILRRTAVKIDFATTDPTGQWVDNDGDGVNEFSQWYGYGRVDAAAAVRESALLMTAHVRQLTNQA